MVGEFEGIAVAVRGFVETVVGVAGNVVSSGAVGKIASRKTLEQIASRIEVVVGVVPVLGGFLQPVGKLGGRLVTQV